MVMLVGAGLLSGDAGKALMVMKSSGSSSSNTARPPSRLLSSPATPPSLHHQPSVYSSSQRLNHSTALTSHYEDLASVVSGWLPSDADAVAWTTVTESGAHVTLPQTG